MKPLLRVMLVMFAAFICIFVLVQVMGLITVDDIAIWLEQAKALSPILVASLVIILLLLDLILSVPTLSLIMLAGFFLGPIMGFFVCLTGFIVVGLSGYGLGFYLGEPFLKKIVKSDDERAEMKAAFHRNAIAMIILSRALPMLPEVSICLAGITRMPLLRFSLAWLASSIPYLAIASYAGSISSIENPLPAIYAAVGLATVLWLGWAVFHKTHNRKST